MWHLHLKSISNRQLQDDQYWMVFNLPAQVILFLATMEFEPEMHSVLKLSWCPRIAIDLEHTLQLVLSQPLQVKLRKLQKILTKFNAQDVGDATSQFWMAASNCEDLDAAPRASGFQLHFALAVILPWRASARVKLVSLYFLSFAFHFSYQVRCSSMRSRWLCGSFLSAKHQSGIPGIVLMLPDKR